MFSNLVKIAYSRFLQKHQFQGSLQNVDSHILKYPEMKKILIKDGTHKTPVVLL